MNLKELCPECRKTGRCWFNDAASEVVASINVSNDKNERFLEAYRAHNEIATGRIMAREKNCPHLNDIDPDYPGKNLL